MAATGWQHVPHHVRDKGKRVCTWTCTHTRGHMAVCAQTHTHPTRLYNTHSHIPQPCTQHRYTHADHVLMDVDTHAWT